MVEETKTGKKKVDQNLQEDSEMVIESSEDLAVVKSFDELGIKEELLRGKKLDS
jgi:hypothetical protein